jgi:F-type H+-transporting ATPase subunit a
MPEHTSFISYLLAMFPALQHNAHSLGKMVISGRPVEGHDLEPITTSFLVALVVIGIASAVKSQLGELAVVPEDKLSLRTFIELFIGYFYDMAKDVMGAKRAKRFFPIIGTCAMFIFFSNLLGIIPGMSPPTSNLSVTFGCSLLVFLLFNYYGFKENGIGYLKHMTGPWLGPLGLPLNILIFSIEVISTTMRLLTLAVRLMINMAVDHLIGSIFIALVALFLPVPAMILGVIVIVVQTLVFCLLTAVYIGLATEHEEHH